MDSEYLLLLKRPLLDSILIGLLVLLLIFVDCWLGGLGPWLLKRRGASHAKKPGGSTDSGTDP